MGRLKDGVDAIEKSQLRSCDKTIYQMVINCRSNELSKNLNYLYASAETIVKSWYASFRNVI